MKTVPLLEGLTFHDQNPYAQPLHVAADGRILRFTLHEGQTVKEHTAPHSPVYVVVLSGQGMFANGVGTELQAGPDSLIIYDAGEQHAIRAVGGDLVFLAFLGGAPGYT